MIFTTNDSAYRTALALRDADVAIAAIVDARPDARLTARCRSTRARLGMPIIAGVRDRGRARRQARARCRHRAARRRRRARLDCDLVCVSGGWNPAVHLFSQARGHAALRRRAGDVGAANRRRCRSSRQARPTARFGLAAALADGHAAGARGCARRGVAPRASPAPQAPPMLPGALQPLWSVARAASGDKRFVDLQNDVTVDDIALAAREGYHIGRASEALHDARHGDRPGQDEQRRRPRAARRGNSARRSPRSARRRSARRTRRSRWARSRAREAARTSSRRVTPRCTTGTPSTARASSTRGCGSGRIRIRAPANRRTTPRTARRRTCARTSASSTSRRWARSSCRGATSPSS